MASSSPVATTISTASGSKTTSSAIKAPPKTSSPTSTTPTTHARYIGAFWGNLDISAFENAVIEDESLRNETGFGKLDVGVPVVQESVLGGHGGGACYRLVGKEGKGRERKMAKEGWGSSERLQKMTSNDRAVPFRLTSELIQQNGDAVYGAAALEVCLDLLGGDGVVDVADEDAAAVDVVAVVGRLLVLLLEGGVHLAQLGGLLLHLGDAALHGRNLFLFGDQSGVSRPDLVYLFLGSRCPGLLVAP